MKYFGSKLGLLQAIFEEAWAEITVSARAAVAASPEDADKVRALVNSVITYVNREPELKLLFLLEGRRVRREDHSVAMSQGYVRFVQLFDSVLEDMRTHGNLRGSLHPQAVRSALFGMMEGLLRDHFLYERLGFPATYNVEDLPEMLDLVLLSFAGNATARTPDAYSMS